MSLSFLLLTACTTGAPDFGPVPAVPAPSAPMAAPVAPPAASPSVSTPVGGCTNCSNGVIYAPPAHKGLFSCLKEKLNCWPCGPMFPAGTAPIVYVQPKVKHCGDDGCWKPGSIFHKCLSKFSLGCNKCDGHFVKECHTCAKPACHTCEKVSCFSGCRTWKNCFGLCNKFSSCVGGCGTGHGTIVTGTVSGGCGSTVIPPSSTVPAPVNSPAKELPKADPKPAEPKKIPEKVTIPSTNRAPVIPSSNRSPIEVVSPF